MPCMTCAWSAGQQAVRSHPKPLPSTVHPTPPVPLSQLNVGVGALAGSTILLLTVPWVLGIVAGRVDLDRDGNGSYTARPKLNPANK
jgi:hypothetical protein